MNVFIGVLIGLLVLTALVIIHELGHFIMAKKNGVKVNEFGVGFPPRAIAWIKKGKKWQRLPKKDWGKPQKSLVVSINWLPIGGFCSLDGESDADTRPHTFGAATFWQKTKILFGGILFNWLAAFVILTILAFTGMPQFIENQFHIANDTHINPQPVIVGEVREGSPAEKAGIKSGDRISAIISGSDETYITTALDIINYNQDHAGQPVVYRVNDQEVVINLNPEDADYILGITMGQERQTLYRSTWSAPLVGAVTTIQLTGETFRGLGQMLWNFTSGVFRQLSPDGSTREAGREDIGKAGDSVSGPIGIVGIVFPAFTEAGPTNLAFLAALISVSLACMNVLPIPALDGGRWILIAVYRLRRKKLTQETEANIISRAFLVLITLIVLITILDITRLFK